MTLPIERTRALRWGWELLSALRTAGNLTPVQYCTVEQILAHYPTPTEISAWAQSNPADTDQILGPVTWLAPEPPDQEPLGGTSGAPNTLDRAPVTPTRRMCALLTASAFLNEGLRGVPNLSPEQHRARNAVCRHFPIGEELESMARNEVMHCIRSAIALGSHS